MRSGWIYGIGLLALLAAGFLFLKSSRTIELKHESSKNESSVESQVASGEKSQPVAQAATPAEDKSSIKPIPVSQPPSLKALRDEVAKNPHETPQALLRFGADLGVRMEEAKKNKDAAIQLLSELKGCSQPASADDSPVQARAICLVTAREIARIWPDLKSTAEEIVSGSDARARELAAKIPDYSR